MMKIKDAKVDGLLEITGSFPLLKVVPTFSGARIDGKFEVTGNEQVATKVDQEMTARSATHTECSLCPATADLEAQVADLERRIAALKSSLLRRS